MRALALLLLSACTPAAKADPGSCFRAVDNVCVEYPAAQAVAGRKMCTPPMTWAPSCPPQSLGVCTKPNGREHMYGGAPNNYTPATAQSACAFAKGSFSSAGD